LYSASVRFSAGFIIQRGALLFRSGELRFGGVAFYGCGCSALFPQREGKIAERQAQESPQQNRRNTGEALRKKTKTFSAKYFMPTASQTLSDNYYATNFVKTVRPAGRFLADGTRTEETPSRRPEPAGL